MQNILVCDDERDIVKALRIYLISEGYNVIEAFDGVEALEKLKGGDIDLVIMDVMMPEKDGITTLMEIRQQYTVPVILLTAKSEDTDKIFGLNVGADDYITKPFNPLEVVARVKSLLRRVPASVAEERPDKLINGGLEIDDREKTVRLDGEQLAFTPTEYDILMLFMKNIGKVFSPKDIYNIVWNNEPYGSESTVIVHIRHIREKIEIDSAHPRYIISVWGHGYKMEKRNRD
ncbi:MAG: response regulator transcription factor [Clostridiales bacterium]|nr:response regulator transcription factor [Clostridiales bacterium]